MMNAVRRRRHGSALAAGDARRRGDSLRRHGVGDGIGAPAAFAAMDVISVMVADTRDGVNAAAGR